MFSNIRQHHQVMKDHSITIKNIFGWSKEPINRILAISSSLLHLIDLILHTLIFLNDLLKFVKSLVIVLHLMRRLKDWSWACPYRTLQFSTSVEVRPGNVSLRIPARVCARVTENRSKDFLAFWLEVGASNGNKSDRARFRKKIVLLRFLQRYR